MLKSPAIACVERGALSPHHHHVLLLIRPHAWVLEGLPEVLARSDPARHRQVMEQRQALRERLRPLLGGAADRGWQQWTDAQGPYLRIWLSGHRQMTERQALQYLERWVWHHREWATRGDGQPVTCPYRWCKRLPRPLEVEHEKAKRWDALQARKRRQREAKVSLNVPAGAQP